MIADGTFATSYGAHPISPLRMQEVVSAMLWDPQSLVEALGVAELMFQRSSAIADWHSATHWNAVRWTLRSIRHGMEMSLFAGPRRARRRRNTKIETPRAAGVLQPPVPIRGRRPQWIRR